jgi:hypothetical protein
MVSRPGAALLQLAASTCIVFAVTDPYIMMPTGPPVFDSNRAKAWPLRCLLQVGKSGRVVGVDIKPTCVKLSQDNIAHLAATSSE